MLWSILKEQEDWVTTTFLAHKCNVSTRTIRSYVAAINASKPYILSSPKGYKCNNTINFDGFHNEEWMLPENRVRYIIRKLLHEDKQVDQYELCDELYISLSTLKNDLLKVKERLFAFDLYLHGKSDVLWCEGNEKNRRNMVSTLLYEESNAQFMNDTLIQKTFATLPISQIKDTLVAILHRYHYFTNDYSVASLLIHICISIERIQNGCLIQQYYSDAKNDCVEYDIAKDLAQYLESRNLCHFNENEINEIALLIASRSTNLDLSNISASSYQSMISEEEKAMIEEMLQRVNDIYYIDLNQQHFVLRFSMHIHNLLIRTQTNYLAKNTLTKEMKKNFPFIYDISVFLADMINEYTGTKINDDEIAYIALHIGSSLDEITNEHNKVTIALLCPQYYDFNMQLLQKLNRQFQDKLLVKHLFTTEQELIQHTDFDLLVATYEPLIDLATPMILIHPLLTEKDIAKIQKFINTNDRMEKNSTLKQHISSIFPEALFFCDCQYKDQVDAIQQMSAAMHQLGCVDESFAQEIMDRESISSTAFDTFALPHSLKMNAHQTCVCVSILHKPMLWGERRVNFIFMISVNHLERKIFKDIFSSLSEILIDPDKITQFFKVTTYEELIEILHRNL